MKKYIAFLLILAGLVFSDQMGIQVESGATDVITYFVMRDRAADTVDTGVTIANLVMYYVEDQAAISADVFAQAHGAVTDAHTDGECIHIGNGVYRVDWPDDAFDGGIGKRVQLIVIDGDAGAFTEIMQVQLSPPSDAIALSGDPTAAGNLEATYDGTGYNDDVAPATQLQLTGIGGGVSIATIATGSTVTEGDETLTYAVTATHDDSYYEVASDTTPVASEDIDFYLTFNTGDGMNFPIFFHLHGYYEDNNAPANSTLNIQSWNFDTSAWNTIATLSDSASDIDLDLPLHVHDVDPDGGGEGDVRIRFKLVATEISQNMRIDHASVNYVSGAVSAAEVADAVWDEVIVSAHDTSNTAGALLDSPGDWATATGFATPTNITAGTITTATNVTTVNGLAANVITAASINDAAFDNATWAADVGTTAYATNHIALAVRKSQDEIRLDHLVAVADADDVVDDSIMGKIASTDGDWSNFSETTDALQSIRDAIALFDTGAEWLSLLSAVDTDATLATHNVAYVTLEAGKASNDAYNGMSISVTDATDGNIETRRIEDWTSGLKATFDRALSFTPVQDDIVRIYAMPYNITAAIAGGSANTYIVTDTGDAGGTPIPDVSVWITADSAGARLVVSGVTDSSGEVVFYLDAGTTYYVWQAKSGYTFSSNGDSLLAE